ncbi:GntR family transcriptional regulator [Aliiruegeria haliotis]|uniref:GntR family transcriptional regulator n=1 Tax=Aliiruegeria haliotis TaxID=1280846 RepID=UPI001304BB0E|nr:GntR family transcriptional regulator [Aliiruegeria haliotis]
MADLKNLRRKAVPLYVELAAILRSRILDGSFKSGERLPTLNDLTLEMGVSRVTVRQAMDILESEGLIERGSGRGTFVNDRPVAPHEVFRMSAKLDTLTALVRGGEAEIISTNLEDSPSVPKFDGVDPVQLKERFTFFRRIHSKGKMPFSLVDVFVRNDVYSLAPDDFRHRIAVEVLAELSIEMSSADQTLAIASADVQDARLLKVDVNSPIADVNRTFRDTSGDVFYAARIKYPSSFISFHIHFEQ